jgi:hypothetical protein
MGKRNQVTVMAPQADRGATASVEPAAEHKDSWWTKNATIWTAAGVIVAIIGILVAYLQWHG